MTHLAGAPTAGLTRHGKETAPRDEPKDTANANITQEHTYRYTAEPNSLDVVREFTGATHESRWLYFQPRREPVA